MSFHIVNDKLLEESKAIWTKIEDLKNIELNSLPVYYDRYIKSKIRTYSDEVYTNFRGLNEPEDGAECASFTIISKEIEPTKIYNSKKCLVCHYCFCNYWSFCNGCHNLTILCVSISDITIVTVKGVDYCCTINEIS